MYSFEYKKLEVSTLKWSIRAHFSVSKIVFMQTFCVLMNFLEFNVFLIFSFYIPLSFPLHSQLISFSFHHHSRLIFLPFPFHSIFILPLLFLHSRLITLTSSPSLSFPHPHFPTFHIHFRPSSSHFPIVPLTFPSYPSLLHPPTLLPHHALLCLPFPSLFHPFHPLTSTSFLHTRVLSNKNIFDPPPGGWEEGQKICSLIFWFFNLDILKRVLGKKYFWSFLLLPRKIWVLDLDLLKRV